MKFPDHKCGLFLEHNEHKNYYQPIAGFIEDHELADDFTDAEAMQRAIDTDELWVLQWYPETPIGFCRVAGATLAEVLRVEESTDDE